MYVRDPCDVTVFASILCDVLSERFLRDSEYVIPYVRDVPGWIAEYVCTAA